MQILVYFSLFSCFCDKMSPQRQCNSERFILTHKVIVPELERVGLISSTAIQQRENASCLHLKESWIICSVQRPLHNQDESSHINQNDQIILHRHALRPISQVVLECVKLTMNTNQCIVTTTPCIIDRQGPQIPLHLILPWKYFNGTGNTVHSRVIMISLTPSFSFVLAPRKCFLSILVALANI